VHRCKDSAEKDAKYVSFSVTYISTIVPGSLALYFEAKRHERLEEGMRRCSHPQLVNKEASPSLKRLVVLDVY